MPPSTLRTMLLTAVTACGSLTSSAAHASSPRPNVVISPVGHSEVSRGRSAVDAQAARDAASPSGRAMPRGDLPGWRQIMRADFTGSHLPAGWASYDGVPGGDNHGRWSSSRVAVRGDRLVIDASWTGGVLTAGGVMALPARQTYGKYEVRFRVAKAAGVEYALLLWPSRGGWPSAGEIDFAEDGGGQRKGTTATLHHGADNSVEQRTLAVDVSSWHTIGVEWTQGRIVYTLNGEPWAHVVSSSGQVPNGPMDLALQVEAGSGDEWSNAPDATTPVHTALEVDWAVAYAPD